MKNNLKNSLEQLNEYTEKIQELLDSEDTENINFNEIMNMYGVNGEELSQAFNNTNNLLLPLTFKKLSENTVTPKYNYGSDSGFDLYSTIDIEIPPFGRALVPTGLSFDIKDGYEIQVRSKSGLAINQGLMCLNSPGTVDNGYTGEVKAIIFNTNNHPVTIKQGMKVAQAVLCPVVNGKWVELIEKEELTDKDRNDKGFGSTGI